MQTEDNQHLPQNTDHSRGQDCRKAVQAGKDLRQEIGDERYHRSDHQKSRRDADDQHCKRHEKILDHFRYVFFAVFCTNPAKAVTTRIGTTELA